VNIELTDPELADELIESLLRCGYRVLRTGPHILAAELDPPPPGIATIPGAAELELDLYLEFWSAKHPGATARRSS
jgi:hypothetical protein